MSSYNFPNINDDDLYEAEPSNQDNFPDFGFLPETPPEMLHFALNMPEMGRQWYNAIEEEVVGPPPTVQKKTRKYIKRDREAAQNAIQQQYFHPPLERMYDDVHFCQRFRMCRGVFDRIVEMITSHDPYFQQRSDAVGRLGFTGLHKCTVALRHLAYGVGYNQLDESFQIAKSTVKLTVEHFAKAIIAVFKEEYLRPVNPADIARLMCKARERGCPGMLGSVDCMHCEWKNCPMGWKGQFQGRSGRASIILEAVASYDTHIWHAFFGMSGANNDINVLDRSPMFDDVCEGRAPDVCYEVNGKPYGLGYYLTDGIYPKWATFMPAYTSPNDDKKKLFTKWQESYRKDVERAFGILQARFAVIHNPANYWDFDTVGNIMMACIILHNMIVEDERDTYGNRVNPDDYEQVDTSNFHYDAGQHADLAQYRDNWREVRNRVLHEKLKKDLTEHVYNHFGGMTGQ